MVIKIHGPYRRKDGRQHIIFYDSKTGQKTTQSYPRYLMEQFLGRKLSETEEVDHINEDPTDDRIENFQILTHAENVSKNLRVRRERGKVYPEWYEFTCPTCGLDTRICYRSYVNNQLTKGRAGPYCSRRCAGIAHH